MTGPVHHQLQKPQPQKNSHDGSPAQRSLPCFPQAILLFPLLVAICVPRTQKPYRPLASTSIPGKSAERVRPPPAVHMAKTPPSHTPVNCPDCSGTSWADASHPVIHLNQREDDTKMLPIFSRPSP